MKLELAMTCSPKLKQIFKNISVGFTTTALLLTSLANPSLGKPSNWSYKIGDNVRFDFKGCTRSNNDVICAGNFRSRSGEQQLTIGPGSNGEVGVSITDTRGSAYQADEVRIGDQWLCNKTDCGHGDFVFVEGVDYKTLFVFKDASIPAPKLALFLFKSPSWISFGFDIRIRSINVVSLGINSSSDKRDQGYFFLK
jgi:hypothetical protein